MYHQLVSEMMFVRSPRLALSVGLGSPAHCRATLGLFFITKPYKEGKNEEAYAFSQC